MKPTSLPIDFQRLFESVPGLYLVLDVALRIVAVSEAYLRATMTRREAIMGRGIFDVFPDNPDDPKADGVRNLRASLERVLKNRAGDAMAVQRYDIRRPETEGGGFEERHWKPFNSPVLDAQGNLAHIIHQVEDVTEIVRLTRHGVEQAQIVQALREQTARLEAEIRTRQETEEKLRFHEALLEETGSIAKVGGWSFDATTGNGFWTDEVARIHGLDPKSAVSRDIGLTYYVGESRARIEAAVKDAMERGVPYDLELEFRSATGELKWVRTIGHPVTEDGKVVRVRGSFQDITERRRLEEQFRQAQKMEAIGTLAGGIAHDFNNILTAILGFAELTRRDTHSGAGAQDNAGEIIRASNRARDLVRQILAFSRKQKHERRVIQLQAVVEESMKMLRSTIPTTIAFEVRIAADAATVLADPTQVHQILMNLGTNAWHAMRDRHGRLEVSLENLHVDRAIAETHLRLNPGRYVRLCVADTGTGMDRATLERVFEPFFTTKAPGEGTGLGLSVVHGIVQDHDGAITVYSEPGQGTVFRIYFPVVVGEVDKAESDRDEVLRGAGECIAFVDDEAALVRLGKKALQFIGYTVEGFTRPEELLELVRNSPGRFAAVITDQTMPEMTGAELARRLLQIRPELPVILTTGYNTGLTDERTRAMGIREVLLKPFSIRTASSAVHRVLRGGDPR